jgi:hypothetical protein
MDVDRAMKSLGYVLAVIFIWIIIDVFLPSIFQATNVFIQYTNTNGFQYLNGLFIAILLAIVGEIVLLKWIEIRGSSHRTDLTQVQ